MGERRIKSTTYTPLSSQPGTLAPLSLNREGAGTCVDTDAWGEGILMVKLFHARPLAFLFSIQPGLGCIGVGLDLFHSCP